ncbi:leucine-rich repeat and immunoglobulin-like domain 2 [Brachionus plicatilis]|uniref:Leucine-rich repeat and immunoglobulin-like domain 2 n=1 Tax=Brachionus plicatilis TaxID=10195 RepID=A0A3M7T2M7_BRAPC|nr:leucine-rich repeat and immunoglobulin-like domain 2 [Brachionus plicatilis]
MNYFCIFLFHFFVNQVNSVVFFTGCDSNCICDYRDTSLVIRCYMPFTLNFFLPNLFSLIQNITSITIVDSFLPNFPSNICQYSAQLTYIDFSDNSISQNITKDAFDCLSNLEYLDLSNNSISFIDENSFDNLQNLKFLDLSYNNILLIATNLFYFKLPHLFTLNLRNNKIEEIDIWFITLRMINKIDLSFNRINKFVNGKNWSPNLLPANSASNNLELLDLRFNNLTGFNDDVLGLYSVCTQTEFNNFFNFFKKLLFTDNNLACSCQQSYNILSLYQNFISSNIINSNDYLFFHQCLSPSEFANQNLFYFTNPDTCSPNSNVFATNCRNATSSLVPENLLNEPKSSLDETNLNYFNDSQIAGYVIGLVGIFFLFLFLIYCICPIEILATCFNCIPIFYRICPCKSGVIRHKELDLFISYNQTSEEWIREKLIPFIKARDLVENFILHYNSANKYNEVFGSHIKDMMNRSSCILFILSDAFLMNEWNNAEFRQHLRLLISKGKARFLAVQMHDVCDEEVDEYFTDKLQIPRFVSLENDEFLFWEKLAYFLYTNYKSSPFVKSNKVNDFDEFATGPYGPERFGSEFSSSSSTDYSAHKTKYQKTFSTKNYKKNSTRTKPVFSPERRPISYSNFKFRHEIIE